MQRSSRFVCIAIMGLHSACLAQSDSRIEFFEKKIRPVLAQHCYVCHSSDAKELKGGLRLDLRSGWQQGGESGEPAIIPGKPDASALIKAVRHDDDASAMPPGKPRLPDGVIRDLTVWIQSGAIDPREGTVDRNAEWKTEFERRKDWWSLRPVASPQAPVLDGHRWSDRPVDRFVLARLSQHGLKPAKAADGATLLRRLSFVLTGLPPSPTVAAKFPARYDEDADGALESLVDELLDSPHFGERIARHWMDVVRYTDTYGYEWDNPAKGSWEYRDYLVRAFNDDVGFDQLVREQIAGDLLPDQRIDSDSGVNESLIGPMFYHMGENRHGDNVQINGISQEMIDNRIDAFSKAFLAMTVACARCHDHKLDAVSQADYYALAGVFMTPRWTARSIVTPEHHAATLNELRRLRARIRSRLATVWTNQAAQFAGEVQAALQSGSGDDPRRALWRKSLRLSGSADEKPAKLGEIEHVAQQLQQAPADADIPTLWKRLRTQWKQAADAAASGNRKQFETLIDFKQKLWPDGWSVDGAGVQTGLVTDCEPLVALDGDAVIQQLLPRGIHTHALSSKLPGAVRLPPQEKLPGRNVSVAMAGDEWSGHIRIADNAFQTETVKFLKQQTPTWHSFIDITRTNGIQRVAYEIATCDLNPNFPPRTGVAKAVGARLPDNDEGINKRSWFSITRVVSHDQPGKPADELQRFARLFAAEPASKAAATAQLGQWLADAVTRFASGDANQDDVSLLNWLLTQGLLDNSIKADAELSDLVTRYREVEDSLPFARSVNSMDERGVTPLNYPLHVRGDIDTRADPVPRNFLEVFRDRHDVGASKHSGRLELARFLTDPQHGLAARVYVNRVWQWVFGSGLVRTPNDFGHLGEQPSHLELLDWLTRRFIADGWSTKQLIRRLVLTATFRQSGTVSEQAGTLDPDNRWLHHYPTRRLEAEAIRDALLTTSGRLDRTLSGRPVNPRRHVEDTKKRLFSGPVDGDGRRSIYLEVSIMDRSKFLQVFNAPDPKLPTGRRDETSGPAQALAMLNDAFVLAMADHWAQRLVADGSPTAESRLHRMFLQALGRQPRPDEVLRWSALVQSLTPADAATMADRGVWKHTAHTLFNTKEFIHYR